MKEQHAVICSFSDMSKEDKLKKEKNESTLMFELIGERSEPLFMVFNHQPRDIYIYIWPMSDRTYKMQAVISPNSNFASGL